MGYNRIGEGAWVTFTVFVYPPPDREFRADRDGAPSWSRGVTFVRDGISIRGSAAEFRYSEPFASDARAIVSQRYRFRSEGRTVEYRVSFPASRESVARPAVEALLASAPWGRVAPD